MIAARITILLALVAPLAAQVSPEIDGASPVPDGKALVPQAQRLFADPHELVPAGFPAGYVATGDVDGDGDVDAFLGSGYDYASYHRPDLWLNLGDGRFRSASERLGEFPVPNGGPVALIDLDGDLDLDAQSGALVFRNDGRGYFTYDPTALPAPMTASGRTSTVDGAIDVVNQSAPGDFDLDGDVDLLAVAHDLESGFPELHSAVLQLADGQGNFLASTALTEEFPSAGLLGIGGRLIADMDGDGDPDAVVSGPSSAFSIGNPLRIFPNDGAGRFGNPVTLPLSHWTGTRALVAADVDGDTDLDLLCAASDSDGGALELFRQLQPGVFSYAQAWGPDELTDIDVGDVDADGDVDVLYTDFNFNPFVDQPLLLNDGAGNFAPDPTLSILSSDPTDAVLRDLDGDDDLDVLIGTSFTSTAHSSLFMNEPAGWTDASGGLSFATAGSIAPGDVDGDGDLDLLVAGDDAGKPWFNPELRVHWNDGSGAFTAGPVIAAGYALDAEAALADVDGDGDLDAFVLNGFWLDDGPALAFENDGQGNFTPAPWSMPKLGPEAPFADVDTDGDLDVLGGGLWFNLTRQVAWRTPAKIGRTFMLDLHGPPRGSWTLYGAPRTGHVPTPFGILLLEPASMFLAGAGSFDARGGYAFAVDVPLDAGLIGQSLHGQALTGTPPRLTNRDTTPITGF